MISICDDHVIHDLGNFHKNQRAPSETIVCKSEWLVQRSLCSNKWKNTYGGFDKLLVSFIKWMIWG